MDGLKIIGMFVYSFLFFLSGFTYGQVVVKIKDPTQPAITVNVGPTPTKKNETYVAAKTFILQSILIEKRRRLALINDKYVQVGNTVEGARILRIESNYVVLLDKGKKLKIYLFEPSLTIRK